MIRLLLASLLTLFCMTGHARLSPDSINPYLLSETDPLYKALDRLFSKKRITENWETLQEAGFEIIATMPVTFIVVARHPDFPGLVFKIYVDSEKRRKLGREHWEALVRRCVGAQAIRSLIEKWQMQHFTVPDSRLYPIPPGPDPKKNLEPLLLIETDMQLAPKTKSIAAWKEIATPQHLVELYLVLKSGYGSVRLPDNVPLTTSGKFAFVDTENIKKPRSLEKVKPHLSEEMQEYWDLLLKKGLFDIL